MSDPQVGDRVTCKIAVDAYYSDYNGNPRWLFEPGMVGTVAVVAAKVRIVDGPQYDDRDQMLVIEYRDPDTDDLRRASLNFCNAELVERR